MRKPSKSSTTSLVEVTVDPRAQAWQSMLLAICTAPAMTGHGLWHGFQAQTLYERLGGDAAV
jgi:hypothetical protein